jgi:hypothetical protein
LAVFCTYGGAGADKVLDALGRLGGKDPVARLALTDDEIDSGVAGRQVDAFVDTIRGQLPG